MGQPWRRREHVWFSYVTLHNSNFRNFVVHLNYIRKRLEKGDFKKLHGDSKFPFQSNVGRNVELQLVTRQYITRSIILQLQ
jgi:hypothetical protein